jgi:hypothetical protein
MDCSPRSRHQNLASHRCWCWIGLLPSRQEWIPRHLDRSRDSRGRHWEISSAVAFCETTVLLHKPVFDKKLLGSALTDQLVSKIANDLYFRFPFLMPGIFCRFLGHARSKARTVRADEWNLGYRIALGHGEAVGSASRFSLAAHGRADGLLRQGYEGHEGSPFPGGASRGSWAIHGLRASGLAPGKRQLAARSRGKENWRLDIGDSGRVLCAGLWRCMGWPSWGSAFPGGLRGFL